MFKLSLYVYSMIMSVSPAGVHPDETPDAYVARAHEIADDIAAVVGSEPAIFEDDDAKTKTASLITSLAFWESNFQLFVDDGTCNSESRMRDWVRHHFTGWVGACDGTLAVSMWQIHPEGGIYLEPGAGWRWMTSKDSPTEIWTRKDLLRSRRAAVRVALHFARQSIQNGARLCQYTSELGPCPKGDARLQFALRWVTLHPNE